MSASTTLRRLQSQATTGVPVGAIAIATVASSSLAVALPRALSEPWQIESALLAVLAVAAVGAAVDVSNGRIPNYVVLASLVPTATVLAAFTGAGDGRAALPSVLAGAVAFMLPLLVVHLVAPTALGFGDVKLAASLGAALGLVDWRYSVAALCLACGLTAGAAIVGRRSVLPFAPGLVAGSALVLIVPLFEWLPSWR